MESISEILVQQSVTNIAQSLRSASDLRDWLAKPNYFVDAQISSTQFNLRVQDWDKFASALLFDMNRFAIAAVESMDGIQREPRQPRHAAWMVVRAYYAAFYSAHAILRLFGRSCTQLDQREVNEIWKIADALGFAGNTTSIQNGLYLATSAPPVVSFAKLNKKSHGDTWISFYGLVQELRAGVHGATALTADKLKTEVFLDVLMAVLCRSGHNDGSWLSYVRNQTNYRFSYDTWFPYKKDIDLEFLENSSSRWSQANFFLTGQQGLTDKHAFFYACFDMVTLCFYLTNEFVNRSGCTSRRLNTGFLKLCKLLSA